jgi:hypothetical protein
MDTGGEDGGEEEKQVSLIAQIVMAIGFLNETSILSNDALRSPIIRVMISTTPAKIRVSVYTILGENAHFAAVQSCIGEMFWREGATAFLPKSEQPRLASNLKLAYVAHPVQQQGPNSLHQVAWQAIPTLISHDSIVNCHTLASGERGGYLQVSVDFDTNVTIDLYTPVLRGLEDAIQVSMEVLPVELVACTVRPPVVSNPSHDVIKLISRTPSSPTVTLRDMVNGEAWWFRVQGLGFRV